MSDGFRPWQAAVLAMLLAQFAAAFPMRVLPSLGPAITASAGIPESAIGHFASLAMVGFMLLSVVAAPLVVRHGPVRTLQAALCLGIVAAAATCIAHPMTLAFASLCAGMGDGPTSAAANRALQASVPAQRRGFAFSLKMVGGPLGGMAAGLCLPAAAQLGDWRLGPALAAGVVLAVIVALQPLRRVLDGEREPGARMGARSLLGIDAIRTTFASPASGLPRIIVAGSVLSFVQGCWLTFLVTFAVVDLGIDLLRAGVLIAVSQASGVLGRLALGALADRIGARPILAALSAVAACLWITLACADRDWPPAALLAIAALGGGAIVGWVGLQHAEIARLAPPAQITTASACAVLFGGFGFLLSGSLFALAVETLESYRVGFAGLAAISAATALALGLKARPSSTNGN